MPLLLRLGLAQLCLPLFMPSNACTEGQSDHCTLASRRWLCCVARFGACTAHHRAKHKAFCIACSPGASSLKNFCSLSFPTLERTSWFVAPKAGAARPWLWLLQTEAKASPTPGVGKHRFRDVHLTSCCGDLILLVGKVGEWFFKVMSIAVVACGLLHILVLV